jgi:predicted nucleotidyltransferase
MLSSGVVVDALEPDPRVRLRSLLAALPDPGVISAYVFGSIAEGRAHRESDVDLGVLLDWSRYPDDASRFEAQVQLRRHLSPASVGRDVDVVVLNDVSPVLARRIVAGEQVCCADPAADHAFRLDTQLRAADLDPFLHKMRRRLLQSLTR